MTEFAPMRPLLLKVCDVLDRPWFRLAGFAGWLLAWLFATSVLLAPIEVPTFSGSDKLGHLALFATLAFTTIAFCRSPRGLSLLAGLTLLGSYLIELGQLLVPSRTYDPSDLVANGAGAALGFVLALLLAHVLQRVASGMPRRA